MRRATRRGGAVVDSVGMADIDLTSRRDTCRPAGAGRTSDQGCAPPAARLPLSCDRIIDAAVRYVDHDCLGGLSMRRLGAELGVEAMSLYRYFPSKAALLDAVVCRMLADVVLPGPAGGGAWEAAVRAYARSFRAVCAAHPRLLPLLATMGLTNPTLVTIDREMVTMWRDAGFAPDIAAQAQVALQGYVTGTCLQACTGDRAEGAFSLGLDALIAGLRERLAKVPLPV